MAFDVSGLFGKGSVAEQMFVYGILQNVIGSLLTPVFTGLQQGAYDELPNLALSAETAAVLVTKGFMTQANGEGIAKQSGFDAASFAEMLDAAKAAPDMSTVVQAYQRGLITQGSDSDPDVTLFGGMRQAGLDPRWMPIMQSLAVDWPSRQEVMNALLEGQIDDPTARDWYKKAGGNMDWYQHDFDANGSAPSPVELGVMVNRGIIPVEGEGPGATSFHQGFLEGPWRNKWEPMMLALAAYRPPPRSVTAMVRSGAYTDAQALARFKAYGMTSEDAAAMLKDAQPHVTTTVKTLTESNVVSLYQDKLITAGEASDMLVKLKYSAADAAHIIAMADFNESASSVKAAVSRVKTLYVQRKLAPASATADLKSLHVPADQITDLIAIWDIEQAANVKQLTAGEITSAWFYGGMPDAVCIANLQAIGYTAWDAWLLMTIRNKGIPDNVKEPAKGPNPVGVLA